MIRLIYPYISMLEMIMQKKKALVALVWSANMGTKSYGKSFSLGLGLGILQSDQIIIQNF
jgi:hypothetical protein